MNGYFMRRKPPLSDNKRRKSLFQVRWCAGAFKKKKTFFCPGGGASEQLVYIFFKTCTNSQLLDFWYVRLHEYADIFFFFFFLPFFN